MHRREDVEKVLRTFPVGDVWGIGRRSAKKLTDSGIRTAWEYTQLPEIAVRKQFALPGLRTWQELRGIPCIEFEDIVEAKQSICVSRSFASEITELAPLSEQIANFAASAAVKLRHQKSLCLEMAVFAVTNRFKENAPQTHGSSLVTFPDGTSDHRAIVSAAVGATRELYRNGFGYKKAGVVFLKLMAERDSVGSIFADEAALEKERRLSSTLDTLNATFGQGAVLFGVQGDGHVQSAREHQSPHYTTLWEDIPKVKV